MFPIVQNLNSLANSVNILKNDVAMLKAASMQGGNGAQRSPGQTYSSGSTSEPAVVPSVIADDINRIAMLSSNGLSELKKHMDTVKIEITRDIGMLEAMIMRKCEVTMHKMINDKINAALEAHKAQSAVANRAMVGAEIESSLLPSIERLRKELRAEVTSSIASLVVAEASPSLRQTLAHTARAGGKKPKGSTDVNEPQPDVDPGTDSADSTNSTEDDFEMTMAASQGNSSSSSAKGAGGRNGGRKKNK